ncbi:MAG: hypothetical protein RL038_399 [Actinomycetota bacterium]|jgi:DNA-binding NarL/FixJ family response regulator
MADKLLKVLLLEDETLSRGLITRALKDFGFEVHPAADLDEAIETLDSTPIDAIVTDIDLGAGQNGIDFLTSLKISNPNLPAVVLSNYRIPATAQEFLKEKTVYLDKKELGDFSELVRALRQLVAGGTTQLKASGSPLDSLSRQQLDILRLISLGFSNQEIADHKGISLRAAEQTIHRMFNKLELNKDPKTNPRVVATKLYLETYGNSISADIEE